MIGTLEEAQAIFEAVGDRWNPDYSEKNHPPGWKYLGSGGTRSVYLSPAGVVYKICHNYNDRDDGRNTNEVEHSNFEIIRKHRKLPRRWRVPKSHLHSFRSKYKKYSYAQGDWEDSEARITILACEYVEGETVGWDGTRRRKIAMDKAFFRAGLFDNARGNAMFAKNGYRYIVDAGEAPLSKVLVND